MNDIDRNEWPFEYYVSWPHLLRGPEKSEGMVAWCKTQAKIDSNFSFKWTNGKMVEDVQLDNFVLDDNGETNVVVFKTYLMGTFFYFKREQDYMLFKLAWQ